MTDERVARGMRRQLERAPGDRIGWKLGLNPPAIMERLGLAEPVLGWLSASRVVEGEHGLAGASQPAVEPELLLEAGQGPQPARMGVALEVVDFDRPLDDLEEVIAHDVFHRAVALGPLGPPADPRELVLSVNGEPRVLAAAEPPARTLAFVADFLERIGHELRPGELVIAGALAPPAPVGPGDVVELASTGLGSVRLAFGA